MKNIRRIFHALIVGPLIVWSASVSASQLDDELMQALTLTPDIENGKNLYGICRQCHKKHGHGSKSGLVPQLAGQHREILIRQLAEFRAGIRPSEDMETVTEEGEMGEPQDIADLIGYIATLPLTRAPRLGPGIDLELGAELYRKKCADCHGETGHGDAVQGIPRIGGQHYPYMIKQLLAFRDNVRTTPTTKMVTRLKSLSEDEISSIADHVARLKAVEPSKNQ